MAVIDDMNRLAALDVVYLRRSFGISSEVFRGRLRQSLTGTWVFNTSTGQNGAVGFTLGGVGQNWNSGESPASGIQVSITNTLFQAPNLPTMYEWITLTSIIPTEFQE